jgi:hypothetical protein
MERPVKPRAAAAILLLGSALGLGCAGLEEMINPPEEEEEGGIDTADGEKYVDTAAKKAAKEERARRKRLASMPKKRTKGPLRVKVKPGSPFDAAEVQCTATNYRKRCLLDNGQCLLDDVPLDYGIGCMLFFQGATRSNWGPVAGDHVVTCGFDGNNNADCVESDN